MKSLRVVLLAWFLFFSLAPIGIVTFLFVRSFDLAYRRETNMRLSSLLDEIKSQEDINRQFILESVQLWKAQKALKDVDLNKQENLQQLVKRMVESRSIDGLALYSRSGRLMVSYQKDDSKKWNYFPSESQQEIFILPKDIRQKIENEKSIFTLKTYPNRKINFVYFMLLDDPKQIGIPLILEVTRTLTRNQLDELKKNKQADLIITDANGRRLLATWKEAPKKVEFYTQSIKENSTLYSFKDSDLGEILMLNGKLKWGESDLLLFAASPKENWNIAIKEVRVYVLILVVFLIVILLVAIVSVTANLIEPLRNLVSVTRKILYERLDVHFAPSPYQEITSLSEAIEELSHDVQKAQGSLLTKIEELKQTQTQLVQSEKLNSLGLLVAGIAHEINNPIGFIYSNLTPLKKYSAQLQEWKSQWPKDIQSQVDPILEDLPKLIESFQEGSLRIIKIVEGLRTFSRQASDKKEKISIQSILDSTLVLLSHEFKTRNVKVTFQEGPQIFINGNMTELSQVFLNIIMNACQSMRQGGQIFIHSQLVKDEEGIVWAQVEIRDTGSGIHPDILPHIFEPFFTTKPVGQGTGLGLSISYGIIQNHGGKIEVKSQIGEGTQFLVFLPNT